MANLFLKIPPHDIWWVPSTYQLSHFYFKNHNMFLGQGESMVKYTKKVNENISRT
jgi:hypothetical protein